MSKRPSCRPVAERFWEKVQASWGGCWLWTGSQRTNGYGQFVVRSGRSPESAHRVAWTLTNGPIRAGLHVCHRCDVPLCVNPAHLFLGTRVDNMQDCVRKGRHSHGEKTPTSKLTAREVIEMRGTYARGGVRMVDLAKHHGVSFQHVSDLIHGRKWAHVGGPVAKRDIRYAPNGPVTEGGKRKARRREALANG